MSNFEKHVFNEDGARIQHIIRAIDKKNRGPSENKIQAKIVKFLESRGAYVARIVKAGKSGTSDLIMCYRGHFGAIEVKDLKGKASPLQLYHLDLVEKAGGFAIVARCVEDVEQVLRYIDDEVMCD